jgi:hypothetical protein
MPSATFVREAVGFVIAPIGAVVAVVAYFWLVYGLIPASPLVVWVLMFAYPAELIIALPGHLLLKRRRVRTLLAYMLLGAATGVTAFIVLATAQGWTLRPWAAWIGVGAGIASALVVWSVAIVRRQSDE